MTRLNVFIIRWFLFLVVGLPFQFIVYLVYPLFYAYFKLNVLPHRQKDGKTFDYEPNLYAPPRQGVSYYKTRDNDLFLDNLDDHNALTHWPLWSVAGRAAESMKLSLSEDQNETAINRRYSKDKINNDDVSGDCLVSWCFAYTQLSYGDRTELKDSILAVAKSYLKYLGCISFGGLAKGWVSNRCNNFGINYCPDDFPVGQPAGGPQFYTSSAIFALAAKVGGFQWKLVYWTHWILLGGWYWALWPFICSRKNGLGYVRHITMKALYVNKWCFGTQWWIVKPMEELTYLVSESRNEFFMALVGGHRLRRLPEILDPWMFQKTDAKAPTALGSDSNGYLSVAIVGLAIQSNELNKRKRGW